jgi:hypothetical protein
MMSFRWFRQVSAVPAPSDRLLVYRYWPSLHSRRGEADRADQFFNFRGTGILPVAEKHGQGARATPNDVT